MLGIRLGRRARDDRDLHGHAKFALEQRIRSALQLSAQDSVTVSEIACADPRCRVDTVVLIKREGERTRALKIAKSVIQVEDGDIVSIVRDFAQGQGPTVRGAAEASSRTLRVMGGTSQP